MKTNFEYDSEKGFRYTMKIFWSGTCMAIFGYMSESDLYIDYIKETKYYDKYYLKDNNYFNLESKEVNDEYHNDNGKNYNAVTVKGITKAK